MKKLLLFTASISVITLVGFFGGKEVCTMMSPMRAGSSQSWYSGLGLSAAQTESLKKTESSFRKNVDALCMRICQERADLLEQVKNGHMSSEIAYKKIEDIGQLQISLEKEVIAHILQVDKSLTPSQSKAYLEKIYRQQCQMTAQSGYGEIQDKK